MTTDFEMFSGDSKNLVVTVKDKSEAAVDLTGASISWGLARSEYASADITKSIGSGVTLTNTLNGEFEITLDPTDTSGLVGSFYHEAQLIEASGDVSTVLSGKVIITKDLIE